MELLPSLHQHGLTGVPPARWFQAAAQQVSSGIAVHVEFLVADDIYEVRLAVIVYAWDTLVLPEMAIDQPADLQGQLMEEVEG